MKVYSDFDQDAILQGVIIEKIKLCGKALFQYEVETQTFVTDKDYMTFKQLENLDHLVDLSDVQGASDIQVKTFKQPMDVSMGSLEKRNFNRDLLQNKRLKTDLMFDGPLLQLVEHDWKSYYI